MSDPTSEPTPDAPARGTAAIVPGLIAEAEKVKAEGGYVLRLDSILNGMDGRLKSAQTGVGQAVENFLAEFDLVHDAESAGEFSLDREGLDDLQTHLNRVLFHLRGARRITKDMLGSTGRELRELSEELGKLGKEIETSVDA